MGDNDTYMLKLILCSKFSYNCGILIARAWGSYLSTSPLENITIAGLEHQPRHVSLDVGNRHIDRLAVEYNDRTLWITGLALYTQPGGWESQLVLRVA